jgi:hypothetical protein
LIREKRERRGEIVQLIIRKRIKRTLYKGKEGHQIFPYLPVVSWQVVVGEGRWHARVVLVAKVLLSSVSVTEC